jgi:hypothetical protein
MHADSAPPPQLWGIEFGSQSLHPMRAFQTDERSFRLELLAF